MSDISDAIKKYAQSVARLKQTRMENTEKVLKIIQEINFIIKYQMINQDYVQGFSVTIENPVHEHQPHIFAGGKLRVGRIRPKTEAGNQFPVTETFNNVIVTSHNQTKLGHSLSPYKVADSKGRIMENIWQFAKIYPKVHDQKQPDWTWDEEVHVDEKGNPTPAYWEWRQAGMEHDKPIRYPNGFKHRGECLHVLWPRSGKLEDICNPNAEMVKLKYIQSRKKVYCPLYYTLIKTNPEFVKLQSMLEKGINLQLLDVDGPDVEKATQMIDGKEVVKPPYNKIPKGIYGVTSGVGSIDINMNNIKLLLEDEDQPFGHGYVLACALLGKTDWLK